MLIPLDSREARRQDEISPQSSQHHRRVMRTENRSSASHAGQSNYCWANMPLDLVALLPMLLPKAVAWAETKAAEIAATGVPLNPTELSLARSVGVTHPEFVRVAVVEQLPLPENPMLRQAALEAGLLGQGGVGLTLGYGIYLCKGHVTPRLLSHECRHVFQYERAGSIAAFLPVYLQQIVDLGYANAPLEIDARAHERDVA